MGAHPNILVVEGESDQKFFEQLCKTLGLHAAVKVAPPRALQAGAYNTKQGVFNYLPTLLDQLKDGQLTRLGVAVDADSPPNGGFPATQALATKTLARFDYTLSTSQSAGLVYEHHDGLADVGKRSAKSSCGEGRDGVSAHESTPFQVDTYALRNLN
jgi:hypothetical protein